MHNFNTTVTRSRSMASTSEKEKRRKSLTAKFKQLRAKALSVGLSDGLFTETIGRSSGTPSKTRDRITWKHWQKLRTYMSNPANCLHFIIVLLALAVGLIVACDELLYDYVVSTPCLVEHGAISDELYRPRVNCDMCRDVLGVPEERNISQEQFYEKYSFTGRPVLVKEGAANWTAMSHFSFKFFQRLYRETPGALSAIQNDCQFFGYETEFITLADALNMSDERAAFQPGEQPWYIGCRETQLVYIWEQMTALMQSAGTEKGKDDSSKAVTFFLNQFQTLMSSTELPSDVV